MITNQRNRVAHNIELCVPHPGHMLVLDDASQTFVRRDLEPRRTDLIASDYDIKSQMSLGMSMKPTKLTPDQKAVADHVSRSVRQLVIEEYSQRQAAPAEPAPAPAEPAPAPPEPAPAPSAS